MTESQDPNQDPKIDLSKGDPDQEMVPPGFPPPPASPPPASPPPVSGYEPPAGSGYGPPPGAPGYGPPPGQFPPPNPGYGPPPGQYLPPNPGYGQPPSYPPAPMGYNLPVAAPPGMVADPNSGLFIPQGTELASIGRRIGAYFLSGLLIIVTLVVGYVIWGLMVWGRGTSPAFQVLGMRVWHPESQRPASWGRMALRDILGYVVTGILGFITGLISFILFLTSAKRQPFSDLIAGTVVLYDPNKVIPV